MTSPLDRTALDSTVDALKPQLVGLAEAWVRHGQSAAARSVEKSQLRLLLQAAKAEPLPVLANLLRYQVGRDKGFYPNGKQRGIGREHGVHDRLLQLMEEKLPRLADSKVDDDASRRQLERELATQLLGFIVREHTYQAAIAKPTKTQRHGKSRDQGRRPPKPRRQDRRKGGRA